jgi:glycosyltransferase involved in cell wall biosynthesis
MDVAIKNELLSFENCKQEKLAKRQPLKIAMFTAVYEPFLSGIALGVNDRVRWLLQQGHEVFLIYPEVNEQYPDTVQRSKIQGLIELQSFSNFSCYAYPTKPLIFYKSAPEPLHYRHWSDTHLLESFQPDVVIISEPLQMRGVYSFLLKGYGRWVASEYTKKTGIPAISLFHTDLLAYSQSYIGKWLINCCSPIISIFVKRFSAAYQVNYFSSWEQLAKYRAMKAQSCEYLTFLGVDTQKFHPRNICYNPIPDDNRPTLVFVGRLAQEKSVTQIINAYPLIAAAIPDVHLVIIGSGLQQEEIRQRAAKFKAGITVWGESRGTEILGWFARADIFVNPSVTENFCRTNMEALASATPVVAARAGGNIEQVFPGFNGFLFEPNNSVDFAQKIITILKNPSLKTQMSKQARLSILRADWSICLENFEDKLYELVENSKTK